MDRRRPGKVVHGMRSRNRSGFTLIELLVVIAIIAILAAILFPVYTRAKDRAKQSTCKSNMKQIATAYQSYTDNWGGAFPDQSSVGFPYTSPYTNDLGASWIQGFAHRYRTDDGGGPAGLAVTLRPYVPNLGVFKCPSEWRTRPPDSSGWLSYTAGSSYYVKHALCFYANLMMRPVRLAEIKAPGKTTLMYEEQWHNVDQRPFLWDVASYPDEAPPKRVQAIFLDCHVGYIDVPFHPTSGYDPNWYFYEGTGSSWAHCANLAKGARDVP